MPPVSLVSQAQLIGEYWEVSQTENWPDFPELPKQINLPKGVAYGNSVAVS